MDEYIKLSLLNNKNINYAELILEDKISIVRDPNNTTGKGDTTIISINWDKTNFDNLLLKLINKKYSYFQKTYDIYRFQNLEYHIYIDSDKPLVYQYNLLDNYKIDNMIYHAYNRNNIPCHLFPSTMNIHDKFTITRITIKVNNRIYLNFEIQKKDNINFYRVYINYNHSSNVDLDNNIKKIKEFLDSDLL
jgi:hypothetical protein